MESENLSFFAQATEVKRIVEYVVNRQPEAASQIPRFHTILSWYQENAELLDPHLESLIAPLTEALLHAALDEEEIDIRPYCILLQCLSKVRGHKSIVKFYPVEVKCFVPILNLLERYRNETGEGIWETQCQLMLWLSSLTLVPFDLHQLDSEASVVERILNIAYEFLQKAGTVREFACILLYRLLTRADMNVTLQGFMEMAAKTLSDTESDPLKFVGVTQVTAFVFKHGERIKLVDHAHRLWPLATAMMQNKTTESALLRKLGIKLVQRIALTLLRPITPQWRYVQTTVCLGPASKDVKEEEVDYEIPDEIEEVIQQLLIGVSDNDTTVRWSAAKGVGRVCSRLPKALADEVLSFILDLFSETAEDSSWHGACLAVAELARRGLLLPESIPTLLPLIEKALLYDIHRGSYSIGANVRDSACFVCWACARSFDAEIMTPYMHSLAPVLMTTACFDREVNCRRAAAAAFQECVGRIGNVPNGIEILGVADYFTLSKRPNAYRVVGPTVATFPAYGGGFIAHLLFEKVGHWDPAVRQLTADALGKLAELDLEYFTCDAMDHLLGWCVDSNLDLRLGACSCLAAVLKTLVQNDVEIPEDRLTGIANIVVKIEKQRLYRGKGGSAMRQGVSQLIQAISETHLTRSLKHRLRLLTTVNECIAHPKPEVPPDALKALFALAREFTDDEIQPATEAATMFYLSNLHSENVAFRRGYTLALGHLPGKLLFPGKHDVIDALCKATEIETEMDLRDVESRANAVKALIEVVQQLYPQPDAILADFEYLSENVMTTLFTTMEDYSTDRRGDVGSWIREAAMDAMRRLLTLLASAKPLQPTLVLRVVSYLVRNSVERISNMRQTAIQNLFKLLHTSSVEIPLRNELNQIKKLVDDDPAAFGKEKGPRRMVSYLKYSEIREALLEGLMASIGGLEKSLSKDVASGLIQFVQDLETEPFTEFMAVLLTLCEKHSRSKRMTAPTLITMDALCKAPSIFKRFSHAHKSQVSQMNRTSFNLLSLDDPIGQNGDGQDE